MISMVGLFTLVEEFVPLMVKPWLAGVLSLVRLMEEYVGIVVHSAGLHARVAETRAPQLPQVMNPKSLRLSQGSMIILESPKK